MNSTNTESMLPLLGSGTVGASIVAVFSYLKTKLSITNQRDAQDWEQMLLLVSKLQDIIVSEREHYTSRINRYLDRIDKLEDRISRLESRQEKIVKEVIE